MTLLPSEQTAKLIAQAEFWRDEAERLTAERDRLTAERDEARDERDRLAAALRGMLDETLRRTPGVNPDGTVSTSSMAETLAWKVLAETEAEARP